MTVSWSLLIDWDNDGSFAYDEASGHYLIDLDLERGISSKALVTTSGNGFETIGPGQGTIILDNHTGRFDPNNTGGALYGKIYPGRKFKITVTYSGVTYNVMAGIIYAIPPITDPEQKHVQLSVRGMMQQLDRNITPPMLYRSGISSAISYLLAQASFPSGYIGTIDTDAQEVTAFSPDKINALTVAQDLAAAALGQIVETADGKINFYWRGHSWGSATSIDQAQVGKNIVRNMPWESIRNDVNVVAHLKLRAAEQIIWKNASPITVVNGTATIAQIKFSAAVDPRVLSCAANQYADGSGLDWTGDITAMLILPTGTSASIVLDNIWTGTTLYVPTGGLVIVGSPINDVDLPQNHQDSGSIATYLDRVFTLDNPWLQDCNHAQHFAWMLSDFLAAPLQTVEITIDTRPDLQYLFDVMGAINWTALDIYGNSTPVPLHVGYIRHKWQTPNGQSVITTVVLMPRLTDGTTIDNDAELPSLPYVPPVPVPTPIPGPTPYPPPTPYPTPGDNCPNSAPANGPDQIYGMAGDITGGGDDTRDGWFPAWIRSSAHANKTQVQISGALMVWNGSAWVYTNTSTGFVVEGLLNGSVVATATLDTYSGDQYGTRTATFDSCAVDTQIDGIQIRMTGLTDYVPGSEIAWGGEGWDHWLSGYTPYKNTNITTVADQLYCIESVSGAHHSSDGPYSDTTDNYTWGAFGLPGKYYWPTNVNSNWGYAPTVSPNNGRIGYSGFDVASWQVLPQGVDPGTAIMLYAEMKDAHYGRLYFQSKITGTLTFYICLTIGGGNGDQMYFKACNASATPGYKFQIASVYISNYCTQSP
jgi:hypothetical protein